MNESRITRIARGCGQTIDNVKALVDERKKLADMCSKMKALKIPNEQLGKVLPPHLLKQFSEMMGMFGGARLK